MDWTFRVGEKNQAGLTWPEWYALTGKPPSYSVDSNRSPVPSYHEDDFLAWRANLDPKGRLQPPTP